MRARGGARGAGRSRGFTLIEAMIAALIVLVIAAIGAPSFKSYIVEGYVKQASSDLLGDMFLARSAAVRFNCDVTIAPVSGSDWTSGWTVSYPSTSTSDLTCLVGGAQTFLKKRGPTSGMTISTVPAPLASIVYGFDGRVGTSVNLNLIPASMGSSVHMRCLGINPAGRPVIQVDRDYDTTNQC